MAVDVRESVLSKEQLLDMYRKMWSIRIFEYRILQLYQEGFIRGATHTYIGEESVAVGSCAALRPDDYITSTHRGHGHCIAKGGRFDLMMAELMGRIEGYCKGKGGSMHIADVDKGILGANGIVGGGMGIATGAALSARVRGTDQVVICYFGDGGINQGALYECANVASIWKLPVIYLCENNHFAMSTPVSYSCSVPDPAMRAAAWGIPGVSIDGRDIMAVYEATSEAVKRARAGDGPTLIVADTRRYEGHNVGDPKNYYTREELEEWKREDCIARFGAQLLQMGYLDDAGNERLQEEIRQEIERAVEFAKASPQPPLDTLMEDIYA